MVAEHIGPSAPNLCILRLSSTKAACLDPRDAEVAVGLTRQKRRAHYPDRLPTRLCYEAKDRTPPIFTSRWIQHNTGNILPGPNAGWRAMTTSSPQPALRDEPASRQHRSSSTYACWSFFLCKLPPHDVLSIMWTKTVWHSVLKKNTQ